MTSLALWLALLSLILGTTGEEVRFGNRVYVVATAADCPDHNYDDPKSTGSYLLSKQGANQGQRTLSMDLQLVHYTPSGATCFRAHPVFADCLQSALSQLKSAGKRALVSEGYRLPSSIGSSTKEEDVFAAAGTAVTLMPDPRGSGDLLDIAQAFLHHCPAKMERIQRNVGVVMKASVVHVFMGGPTDPPVLTVDGYTGLSQAAFLTEALSAIDYGLEMDKRATDCTRYATLTSGDIYPANSTGADMTVGEMDEVITRDNAVDFVKLVQFIGNSVQFENAERTASWCGTSGNPCVDCRNGPVDVTLANRCTARMMTPRMNDFLILLQKVTTSTLGDSLLVTQAWDEDYDGHTAPASSLHREGRAILVKLATSNTAANLATLSQLAMCADADFIQHNNDHLLVAVQKQQGYKPSEVTFPQATLIRVEPPVTKAYVVSLPDYFVEADNAEFPLLDSAGRESLQIAAHTTLGQFVSGQTRYLRLNPYVVECYSKLQDYFAKREALDGLVTLDVVRGFLATPERDVALTPTDHRYASGVLGLSFEICPNASLSTQNVTLANLARLAVTQCTPVFQENEDAEIGVGLYHDRVYVDMRDTYKFWNPAGSFTSHVRSAAQFSTYMRELFDAAADGRIIEPDSPTEAEQLAEPGYRQNVNYRYITPERILRSRNVTTVAVGECVPNTATTFCQESQEFRHRLVNKWWVEASKKHNYHDPAETRSAFYGCFDTCGTCLSGSAYEAKLEHCSNFMHWAPFEMAPDGTAMNLFPRERAEMRRCACQGSSSHCIEDSALFLLMVNVFEATFRPDPANSVAEDMYPQTENPSPAAELLNQLYATHHEGVAKIWVQDDTDIAAMRGTLEKLMVYNPNVTEVKFYVNETTSIDAVEAVLRSLILEWVTSSSPLYSREYVAPFTISDMAPHCTITSKRATQQHSVRDEMIQKILSQQDRYLEFDL